MGCGCGSKNQTVTRYRVMDGTIPKDFVTRPEADTYRTTKGIKTPVQVVKVPKT